VKCSDCISRTSHAVCMFAYIKMNPIDMLCAEFIEPSKLILTIWRESEELRVTVLSEKFLPTAYFLLPRSDTHL